MCAFDVIFDNQSVTAPESGGENETPRNVIAVASSSPRRPFNNHTRVTLAGNNLKLIKSTSSTIKTLGAPT